MSSIVANRRSICNPCGFKPAPEKAVTKAPRLVLGPGESELAAKAAVRFRQIGWEVCLAATGEEARRQAVRGRAHALVLALGDDNLLHTAKLLTALPKRTKVILVGPAGNEELERAGSYLGAVAYVADAGGVEPLVEAVVRACGS